MPFTVPVPVKYIVLVPQLNVPSDESQLPLAVIFEFPVQVTMPLAAKVIFVIVHPFTADTPIVTVPTVTDEAPAQVRSNVLIASVPPEPLMVSAPQFTLPVNVAVPTVFVIDKVPLVVKPAMLFAATVPLSVTALEPKFSVPPPVLVRVPWMINPALAPAVPVPLNTRF